jgi:hypothetical protein
MTVQYKNYILKPLSHQSPETNKWSATIEISKHDESGTYHCFPFLIKTTFTTKEEADDNSLLLGKSIIDGNDHTKLNF